MTIISEILIQFFLGELEKSKVAIAISGGSDSMALAALACEALGKDRVTGLIVDHQMQKFGVSENTEKVQDNLMKLGIHSDVLKLKWNDQRPEELSIPSGRIMMQSRENRYRSLFDACKKGDIPLLLTGHNLEDDIITMFYRISRMSGLDGLAGMKLVTTFPFAAQDSDSTFILRPLLPVPKLRLINTCLERGISWTEDRSNDDLGFRRNECLHALIDLQRGNKNISTDALIKMLESYKGHRSFIQQKGIRSKTIIIIL